MICFISCLCEEFHDTKLIAYENDTIKIDSIDFESDFMSVSKGAGLANWLTEENQFSLETNPVTGFLNLRTVRGDYLLTIRDISGITLLTEKVSSLSNDEVISLNVSSLRSGMYNLSINNDEARQVIPFVKQ